MATSRNTNQERDVEERISVLGVVPPAHGVEIESILSHTRWNLHLVHSIEDAVQAIRSLPASVILCERRLSDGTWMDLFEATTELWPRPQIVVLSADADMQRWAEILNCGGYDLLARPLRPSEIYDVVPMAWRQSKEAAGRTPALAGQASRRALIETRLYV